MTVVPEVGNGTPTGNCDRRGLVTVGPGARSRRLRVDLVGEVAVVELGGDIDVLVAEPLRESLLAAGAVRARVVLDLADAGTIDSAGLGALVRAQRRLRRYGVPLCLVAPSRYVVTVLRTLRLDRDFPVFVDRARAVAAIH
jgi:anti-sigma B factor antagonist